MTNTDQVAPLPSIGPGAANAQLNNISIGLSGTMVQASEDSKYDSKYKGASSTSINPAQGFCSPSANVSSSLMMIGILLIVYGVIAK
jgi:hypothetical protein